MGDYKVGDISSFLLGKKKIDGPSSLDSIFANIPKEQPKKTPTPTTTTPPPPSASAKPKKEVSKPSKDNSQPAEEIKEQPPKKRKEAELKEEESKASKETNQKKQKKRKIDEGSKKKEKKGEGEISEEEKEEEENKKKGEKRENEEGEEDGEGESDDESDEKLQRTIFVGNLSFKDGIKGVTKELKKYFGKYGPIESIRFRSATFSNNTMSKKANFILENFHEERANGNCYIVFKNAEDAKKSLRENAAVFLGNHIRVDLAEGDKKADRKLTVFVGNLPFTCMEEDLWNFFGKCGEISHVRVVRDSQYGVGKGIAFVIFKTAEGCAAAIKLNDTSFLSRKIRVLKYSRKDRKDRRFPEKVEEKNERSPAERRREKKRMLEAGKPRKEREESGRKSFEGVRAEEGQVPNIGRLKQKKKTIQKKRGHVEKKKK